MAIALISISPLIISPLVACTSKQAVLPQDGPTMLDIYYGHFEGRAPTPEGRAPEGKAPEGKAPEGGSPAGGLRRPAREGAIEVARDTLAGRDDPGIDLAGFTRSVETETRALFPRLSNPEIILYVYPHLAGPERLPVPGYSTAFPLYERTEYALPGETLLPRPPISPPADPLDELRDPPTSGDRLAGSPPLHRAASQ